MQQGTGQAWTAAAEGATDLDAIREAVSSSIEPHGINRMDCRGTLDARNGFGEIMSMRLVRLSYGANVMVDRYEQQPENGVLVEMVRSGHSNTSCGGETVLSTPKLATVLSPHLSTKIHYSDDCDKLVLRLDRHRLAGHLQSLLGRSVGRSLTFAPGLPLDTPGGQDWLRLVGCMEQALSGHSLLLSSPIAAGQFEQLVMTTLLLTQPHNYSEVLHGPENQVAPHYVRRAEAFIEAHLESPITIADLATHAEVSARSLQTAFQRFRGTTPMALIRDLRLDRVRQTLSAGDAMTCRVTDVALQWGFTHLGKFAEAYRKRFGETPSMTLRR